jgi:ABC-2 type transport system ATP-binding protein
MSTVAQHKSEEHTDSRLNARSSRWAVEVRDLHKTYANGVQAVRGVDFEVDAGEVFGLLGPNGAGKSTTIGMLTTSIVPSGGSARVAGYDVAGEPLLVRRASSVIFQDASVDRQFSGRANLDLHARLWQLPAALAERVVVELAQALGLTELLGRAVASYSGGERRRLEIARALVSQPQVLFMDEPTVGLDPRMRHELLDVLDGIRARKELTIVITTHDLDEARRLCDRVAIVQRGRIIALDTPAALLARLGGEILEFRVDGDPQLAIATLRAIGSGSVEAFNVGARVLMPLAGMGAAEAIAAVDGSGVDASQITTRPPTLDDAYLFFTGEQLSAES